MPRAGLDQAAVIDAAASIANAEGLSAVTLARIAAECGVRPPSLYKHVDGLAGVMRGLALRGMEEMHRHLSEVTVGRSGDDALMALTDAYWRFAHEHPGLYAASTAAPATDDAKWNEASNRVLATLMAVLRAYDLEGDDALHAIRAIRAITHGFVSLEANGGFGLPLDVEDSFHRLVRQFADGLKKNA